jgi:ribonuclease BN (tRNA processing enzyme)
MVRMSEVGLKPTDIDGILLTHYHVDHCSDLAPLLFARRSPELPLPENRLLLVGAGINEYFRRLHHLNGGWIDQREGPLLLVDAATEPLTLGPWQIETARTNHIDSSIAYRFDHSGGSSLVISGDTGPSDDLVALAKGAQTLILECSFPDPSPFLVHLTPSTAGSLASRVGCRRLVLTHFYPAVEAADILRGVREHYAGSAILAEDLMTLTW